MFETLQAASRKDSKKASQLSWRVVIVLAGSTEAWPCRQGLGRPVAVFEISERRHSPALFLGLLWHLWSRSHPRNP